MTGTTGSRIRALREAKGLTQKQLADSVGTSQNQVSRWEGDHVLPDTRYLVPLADTLHTTADNILRSDSDLPRGLAEAVAKAAELLEAPVSPEELAWCRAEVRSHGDVGAIEWLSRIRARRRGLTVDQVAREHEATTAAAAKGTQAGVRPASKRQSR